MGRATGTAKRGRKTIHEDARARKKAYYERHAESEREKARERWHRNRARAKERELEARRVLAREQELMPRTAKGTMCINEYTRLLPLSVALEEDLRTWGPGEGKTTDRAQFRSLTKTAIHLYEADEGHCKEEFAKVLESPLVLVNVVQKLARFAAGIAERRKQDIVFRRLNTVAHMATKIRVGLEELMDLYHEDPSTLRSKQIDKLLYWQI